MTPVPWPWWGPWLVWVSVIACGVVVASQAVKLALYKRPGAPFRAVWDRQRRTTGKTALLLPWQGAAGAFLGLFLLPEAGLLQSYRLSAALGFGIGAVAWPIYDALFTVPAVLVGRIKGGGTAEDLAETQDVPTLADQGDP